MGNLALRQPPGVLGEIVAHTVAGIPDGEAELRVRSDTARGFERALRQPGIGLIAEVKPRSPSEGALRDLYDPAQLRPLLDAYTAHASAISVLVDEAYFGGGYDLLRTVRSQVNQPVMAKGFFVHPHQLNLAAEAGADAVLLMATLLPPESLARMLEECKSRGLECLVEAHDQQELNEALASPAPVVGVNSRNLKTLKIDLAYGRTLLGQIPEDRVRVFESGIQTAEHIQQLNGEANAVLIGTSLVKADDPSATIVELGLGRGA